MRVASWRISICAHQSVNINNKSGENAIWQRKAALAGGVMAAAAAAAQHQQSAARGISGALWQRRKSARKRKAKFMAALAPLSHLSNSMLNRQKSVAAWKYENMKSATKAEALMLIWLNAAHGSAAANLCQLKYALWLYAGGVINNAKQSINNIITSASM